MKKIGFFIIILILLISAGYALLGENFSCNSIWTRADRIDCISKEIINSEDLYSCGTLRNGQRECEEAIASKKVVAISKEFCDSLLSNSNESNCATCNVYNYSIVGEFNKNPEMWIAEYTITRNQYINQTKNAFVNVSIPVIYGWNTRSGHKLISFEVLEDGSIANKEFPLQNCL